MTSPVGRQWITGLRFPVNDSLTFYRLTNAGSQVLHDNFVSKMCTGSNFSRCGRRSGRNLASLIPPDIDILCACFIDCLCNSPHPF